MEIVGQAVAAIPLILLGWFVWYPVRSLWQSYWHARVEYERGKWEREQKAEER